jgi:hypothetical protein
MNAENTSSKIASWSLILVGFGHTITYLTSPKNAIQIDFVQRMKEFPIEIMGTESNIFSFYEGFSLMMGLFLFSYGLLNILILRNHQVEPIATNIVILNSIVCLISFILSLNYFFIVPIVFTGIAFLGFTISLITKLRK